MAEHKVEIVEIDDVERHPHPAVLRMQIVKVWGWQCCIGMGEFKRGDKAIFVEPDYLVPVAHPAFAFLKPSNGRLGEEDKVRVRVRRFKGALSQGLLIKVPPELKDLPVGTNVIEQLGIEKYEPPIKMGSSVNMFTGGPSGVYAPKFDVENWQKYADLFSKGEPVIVTEKLHGANARFVYAENKDGEMTQFCGSRNNWMAKDETNLWWRAFEQDPDIGVWCRDNPGMVLYGEVFGQVQTLKYGTKPGEVKFAGFAVLSRNTWMDFDDVMLSTIQSHCVLLWAPLLYRGPFNLELIRGLSEGSSTVEGADHIREGCVVIPEFERTDPELGRVILKWVSNEYLEKH